MKLLIWQIIVIGKKVMSVVKLDENQYEFATLIHDKNVVKIFVYVVLLVFCLW